MNTATMILAIVPVVVLMAFILLIVKEKVIDHGERSLDMKGVVGVLAIVLIAVVLMGSMISESIEYYEYDEDTGELTITYTIAEKSSYPWDAYGSAVKTLVIEDGVESVPSGAFDSLTALEFVSVPSSTEVPSGAFAIAFADPFGTSVSDPAGHSFAGSDGTLYRCDPSIFTYSNDGKTLTGLSSSASAAKYIVLPASAGGIYIEAVGQSAFRNNTTIEKLYSVPGSHIAAIQDNAFNGCTSLATVDLPEGLTTLGGNAFYGCTSLATVDLPESITSIGASAFRSSGLTSASVPQGVRQLSAGVFEDCSSLESISLPAGLTSIGQEAFTRCTSLTSIDLPSRLETIGLNAFRGCTHIAAFEIPATTTAIDQGAFSLCTGVSAVSFGSGFSATLGTDCFVSWTFYATDGTTVIDKTVASNLAGKSFQGTAAALVELASGRLTLSPQQFQQVQIHTQELQQQELDVQPMPFQPSLQTEQEPVAA